MMHARLFAAIAVALALTGCPKEGDVTIEPIPPRAGAPAGAAADPHAGHNHAPGEGHGADPQAAGADPHAGMQLPPDHPPVGGGPAAAGMPVAGTDGHPELPLKKTGI